MVEAAAQCPSEPAQWNTHDVSLDTHPRVQRQMRLTIIPTPLAIKLFGKLNTIEHDLCTDLLPRTNTVFRTQLITCANAFIPMAKDAIQGSWTRMDTKKHAKPHTLIKLETFTRAEHKITQNIHQ